jgi:hypothetical protein
MADAPILRQLVDHDEGEYRREETGQTTNQFEPIRIEEQNVVDEVAEGEVADDDMSKFSQKYSLDDPFVQKIFAFKPPLFDPCEDLFDDSTVIFSQFQKFSAVAQV